MNQPSAALAAQLAKQLSRLDVAANIEEAIKQGQHDLALLDSTIVERELIVEQQQSRLATQEKLFYSQGKKLQALLEREQAKLDKLQTALKSAKSDLEVVKSSIQERQDYYKEQELLIAKQAEDGNLQLRGLEYEIIETKQVIKDLEQKRRNLYEEGQTLESDLEAARNSFAPEIAEHEAAIIVVVQRKEVAETDLLIARQQVYDANKEFNTLLIRRKQVHADIDAKLQLLDVKEREIMAKREAMRIEMQEVEEAKHRLTGVKSLYDIN